MIYTERVINVKNGTASIDQPIVLFRGDRNIEIVFEIVNSKFKFSEKGNYILDIGAKYGQLAVEMPDGTDLFTEIAECLDGKVIFKITGDMINEIAENGFYSFHVRLFNDDKTSRVTIPPIMEGIEVREPIVIEGDGIFPIVDMGKVDIASIDSEEESFIDENGKLNIVWQNGDIISSTKLNQMIEFINDMEDGGVSEDVLANYATIEYVNDKEEQMEIEIAGLINMISAVDNTASNAMLIAQEASNTADYKYDELSAKLTNQHNALQTIIDQNRSNIEDHEVRIQTLEQTDGGNVDLSGYATKDELEETTNILQQAIEQNASDIASNFNSLDERINDMPNEYATISYVDDEIGELQNGISDHEERLQSLEQTDGGNVDLSGYATTEYVDGQINPIEASVAEHTGAIGELNATIGDINSILDAINGEVI